MPIRWIPSILEIVFFHWNFFLTFSMHRFPIQLHNFSFHRIWLGIFDSTPWIVNSVKFTVLCFCAVYFVWCTDRFVAHSSRIACYFGIMPFLLFLPLGRIATMNGLKILTLYMEIIWFFFLFFIKLSHISFVIHLIIFIHTLRQYIHAYRG